MRSTLIILIIACPILAWCQNEKLDSLYHVLKNHPGEDTSRVNILTEVCFYEHTSDPEKSKLHAEEAKRLAEKINYPKGIGLSLRYLANYYLTKGDFEKAVGFALAMLKNFEAINNTDGLVRSYQLLGSIHGRWNNFDKSKEYLIKALELSLHANMNYNAGYIYNHLGALHHIAGREKEAISYFQKSLAIRKEINDVEGISQSYVNLGQTEEEKQNYSKAIEYYRLALPTAKKTGDKHRVSIIFESLGICYSMLEQFEKADSLLQSALTMVREMDDKEGLSSVYEGLLSLERRRGNYKKALDYALLGAAFNDSIFNEEKIRQVAEMEARYESEKKEKVIQLLERDNQIKSQQQNILMGSILGLLLTGALIYRIQRLISRKKSEMLKTQQVLNENLQAIDKAKANFFTSVSHEFRTPLTLIKAPIEEFLEHPEQNLTVQKAQMVHRNANRLLQLVNQLLDLSKIDAGNLKPELKPGDIHAFLRTIASSFDFYSQQHHQAYISTIPETTLFVLFDQDKLEKIVYNLHSNALKFTPQGKGVEFRTSYEKPLLKIEVTDSGIGIKDEHLPHIFDRFYQVAGNDVVDQAGSGIGLSLVKELVTLLGGAISVHSVYNEGSVFTVSLPVTEIDEVSGEITAPEHYRIKEEVMADAIFVHEPECEVILVVEDNPDMRRLTAEQFANEYNVLFASNGKQALDISYREIPDVIITDIMMPEMDGLAFCKAIKNDERTSHVPVILLTAKEGMESKLAGLNTGADDYLTKPFNPVELLTRTKNLIAQRKLLHKKYRQQITLRVREIPITSVEEKFLKKIEDVIEQKLSKAEFGVPQLQDVLAMSKTQLHRKMKGLTGQPPGEFLRHYRLKRAAQLLKQQGGLVKEIASDVGFASLSYFTRSFKDLFGQSPSEYAKNTEHE